MDSASSTGPSRTSTSADGPRAETDRRRSTGASRARVFTRAATTCSPGHGSRATGARPCRSVTSAHRYVTASVTRRRPRRVEVAPWFAVARARRGACDSRARRSALAAPRRRGAPRARLRRRRGRLRSFTSSGSDAVLDEDEGGRRRRTREQRAGQRRRRRCRSCGRRRHAPGRRHPASGLRGDRQVAPFGHSQPADRTQRSSAPARSKSRTRVGSSTQAAMS